MNSASRDLKSEPGTTRPQPLESEFAGPMSPAAPSNVGAQALEGLIRDLGLAGPALTRSQAGFAWQGPRLRMEVQIEPTTAEPDREACRLSAQTLVLTDLPASADLRAYLTDLNRGTAMGAWCHEPETGRLRLACSVPLRAADHHFWETWFLLALALQLAQAEAQVEDLARRFGVRSTPALQLGQGGAEGLGGLAPDGTAPDPLRAVLVEILQAGHSADSPFVAAALSEAALAERCRWILPMADARGLSALLPFDPTMRVGDFFAEVEAGGDNPNCARLRLDLAQPHPSLGAGLLCLLELPPDAILSGGAFDAHAANLAAAREGAGLSQIGAWCEGDRPTFVAFLPLLLLLAAEDAIVDSIQSLLAELACLAERIVAA